MFWFLDNWISGFCWLSAIIIKIKKTKSLKDLLKLLDNILLYWDVPVCCYGTYHAKVFTQATNLMFWYAQRKSNVVGYTVFGNSSLLTPEQYTLCLNQWESPSGSRVSDNHLKNWWISRQEQTGAGEGGEVEFTWWHVLNLLGSYCCLRTGIILLFYFQIITVHF